MHRGAGDEEVWGQGGSIPYGNIRVMPVPGPPRFVIPFQRQGIGNNCAVHCASHVLQEVVPFATFRDVAYQLDARNQELAWVDARICDRHAAPMRTPLGYCFHVLEHVLNTKGLVLAVCPPQYREQALASCGKLLIWCSGHFIAVIRVGGRSYVCDSLGAGYQALVPHGGRYARWLVDPAIVWIVCELGPRDGPGAAGPSRGTAASCAESASCGAPTAPSQCGPRASEEPLPPLTPSAVPVRFAQEEVFAFQSEGTPSLRDAADAILLPSASVLPDLPGTGAGSRVRGVAVCALDLPASPSHGVKRALEGVPSLGSQVCVVAPEQEQCARRIRRKSAGGRVRGVTCGQGQGSKRVLPDDVAQDEQPKCRRQLNVRATPSHTFTSISPGQGVNEDEPGQVKQLSVVAVEQKQCARRVRRKPAEGRMSKIPCGQEPSVKRGVGVQGVYPSEQEAERLSCKRLKKAPASPQLPVSVGSSVAIAPDRNRGHSLLRIAPKPPRRCS